MKPPELAPAPWALGIETCEESAQIINAEGWPLATIAFDPVDEHARAFIALPECLAALNTLLARCASLDQSATHDGLENCKAIAKARAALLAAGFTE